MSESTEVAAVFARSAFLATLPPDARRELAAQAETLEFPAGRVVLWEGEEGDRYYLIDSGEAEVWAARGTAALAPEPGEADGVWEPDPNRYALVAKLGPGDGFGEMALLLGGRRRATVRASSPLRLFSLRGPLFAEVVNRHRGLSVALEEEMALRVAALSLGKSSPFATLSPETLRRLAARIERVRLEEGREVFHQGDEGDAFYLIRGGRAAVLIEQPDGTEVHIASLGPGDPFGEQALLASAPRSATIRALEPLDLLRLDREGFEQVLRQNHERQEYFLRLVLQRQRPRRIEDWVLEQPEQGGEGSYVLKDPRQGHYVKLSEQGAFLWNLMDGRNTVRDLTLAYFARYRVLGLEAVVQAMMQLHAAGFVILQHVEEVQWTSDGGRPPLDRLMATVTPWLVRYFSVPRADRKAERLYRWLGRPLFSLPAQLLLLGAALAGTAFFTLLLSQGQMELPPAISLKNAAASVILGIVLHGLVHELGHALTCKHFGREVPGAGVGWYYFLPVAYVDTSDIWMSPRRHRIAVALAGVYANFVVAALATLLIPLVATAGWKLVLFQFAVLGYALGLSNLNPLAEFDGYYALADWLGVPNLRSKALAFLGLLVSGKGLATRELRLLVVYPVYGLLALLYTVLIPALLLLGYQGLLLDFMRRIVSEEMAAALGWAVALLVGASILFRAGAEVAEHTRRVQR